MSLTCLLLGVPKAASAETIERGKFGIGLIVGEPTGVAVKQYLTDNTAIAGAVGFAFVGGGLHAHADYLWHPWVLTRERKFILKSYLGPGLRVFNHNQGRGSDSDDLHIGARATIGVQFEFTEVPLDAFVEAAGILEYRSDDGDHGGFGKFNINAGAGVRYYF